MQIGEGLEQVGSHVPQDLNCSLAGQTGPTTLALCAGRENKAVKRTTASPEKKETGKAIGMDRSSKEERHFQKWIS